MTLTEKRDLFYSLTDRMSLPRIRSYYHAYPHGFDESQLDEVIAKCCEILGEKAVCPCCERPYD